MTPVNSVSYYIKYGGFSQKMQPTPISDFDASQRHLKGHTPNGVLVKNVNDPKLIGEMASREFSLTANSGLPLPKGVPLPKRGLDFFC